MNLTVLNWFKDASKALVGKTIEILFRLTLIVLPLGLYLLLIQGRNKASSVRSIPVYTNDESRWQFIFPGFILVAVDPNIFKKSMSKIRADVQRWLLSNRYILEFLFAASVVALLIFAEAHK